LEAENNAQNITVDTARGKDNDQQNLSKMKCDIGAYRNKSHQMSEDTSNPDYKLMTDNLQLVLINALTGTIFEH